MTGAAAITNKNDQLRDAKAAFAKTKAKVGDAASFVKTKSGEYKAKAGVFIADCKEKSCKLVNKPRSPSPTRSNGGSPRRGNYQRNQRRSGYRKMKRSSPLNTRLRSCDAMSMEYSYWTISTVYGSRFTVWRVLGVAEGGCVEFDASLKQP
ncbi:unnamed protein product [Clonostachys rhizophaga]|uniref:Uncharacterized protein n=1 Tax=Clonostachys rhizophaga TaxID=160324 RepID=A0A9N9VUE8_9HYPO|nr:unnamed protein product [Clonostachys rhizophaga]